jgi:hypothetical protein
MLLAATAEFLRACAVLARRADSGLAETAARNAAIVVTEHGTRRLEDARTMRDLSRLGFGEEPAVASSAVASSAVALRPGCGRPSHSVTNEY